MGPSHKETLQLDHSVKQQYREKERTARLEQLRIRIPPALPFSTTRHNNNNTLTTTHRLKCWVAPSPPKCCPRALLLGKAFANPSSMSAHRAQSRCSTHPRPPGKQEGIEYACCFYVRLSRLLQSPREEAESMWDLPTPSGKRLDRRPPGPARGERTAEDPVTVNTLFCMCMCSA